MKHRPSSRQGFTLAEMAVVLIIIGTVIISVYPALAAMRVSAQRSATQSHLQALMNATAVYTQTHGCLPCPTPSSVTGASFGMVRGDGVTAACNGCAVPEGIVPYLSLGVPVTTAQDGWGNWITMRVDPALTASTMAQVVPPTLPVQCSCTYSGGTCVASTTGCSCGAPKGTSCPQPFNQSVQGMCAPNLATNGRMTVVTPSGGNQQAAVIYVSHGSHGYGAYVASPQRNPSMGANCRHVFPNLPLLTQCTQALSCADTQSGIGAAECNAAGLTTFVNATAQQNYDDMMMFADRNTLVSWLGNGSCQTTW